VAVENIKNRNVKTEVEKGSVGTVIVYGLAGPKRQGKSRFNGLKRHVSKGKKVKIPLLKGLECIPKSCFSTYENKEAATLIDLWERQIGAQG
jgi:hypothetical protein